MLQSNQRAFSPAANPYTLICLAKKKTFTLFFILRRRKAFMHQRGTTTDRLADIIQVLRLAHKTGILTVERGEAGTETYEEGTMHFVDGQVIEAHTGYRDGIDAFNWLSTWRTCRFGFTPTQPSNGPASYALPPYRSPISTPRPTDNRYHPQPSTPTDATPRRLRHPNQVLSHFEHLGLSRTHRHLFLLIDGKRTTTELIRLMQHRSSSDEVYALLADLERAGLIQQ
jgi:hypothetical protein